VTIEAITTAELLEAGMLICFGISWPVDILKALRTQRTEGKSLGFMSLILLGYLSGISAKLFRASGAGVGIEWVTLLYAFNALMVAVDIGLYLRFRPRPATLPNRGFKPR
jgi:uncharacterized membrane protein